MEKFSDQDIITCIQNSSWHMNVLQTARDLNLPQWMIGAGFVRNTFWDHIHNYTKPTSITSDVDLIYFDPLGNDEKSDQNLSQKISNETNIDFEIINQAYTHSWKKRHLYTSSEEALGEWVETATCVAVSLDDQNNITIHAPIGTDDLLQCIARHNPSTSATYEYFLDRVKNKNWQEKWPQLTLIHQ